MNLKGKAMNRIPKSLSEWFESLPEKSIPTRSFWGGMCFAGSESDGSEDDLKALFAPAVTAPDELPEHGVTRQSTAPPCRK